MASYCGKCGSELSPDKQFCPSCGAPTGAGAPATAPVPPYTPVTAAPFQSASASQYQPPASPPFQPAAAPASSGGNAIKIILIVVAIFVGLGVLGAGAVGFIVWRVAHAVHVSGNGNNVTLNTPGGTISANTAENFTASDLGTDIYPGAQAGKGSMRMNMPTGSMVSAVYVTGDSKDQVVSYYKSKFGNDASVFDSANSAVLTLNKGKQESVMVTVSVNSSENEGKTQIHIVHSKSDKP